MSALDTNVLARFFVDMSGTTGRLKGVVHHHRGAQLPALGNVPAAKLPKHPDYLWTLPMFRCNGSCSPWTITALKCSTVGASSVMPSRNLPTR